MLFFLKKRLKLDNDLINSLTGNIINFFNFLISYCEQPSAMIRKILLVISLSLKEILLLFISFYYVRGIKLNNGIFDEIFVGSSPCQIKLASS